MSKIKSMTLRLPADQAAEVEAIAGVEKIPVSQFVREAIDAHIAERRKDTEFKARLKQSIESNIDILERLAR